MAAHSDPQTSQQASRQPVLWRLANLSFAYRDRPVLRGLTCTLCPGRCIGILGPNGSGKSTLLDILSGLLTPQSGTIEFLGQPLARHRRRDLARILALVPQQFRMRFDFSVREVVEMGLHPHLGRFTLPGEKDRALVNKVMRQTGVLALADRPITRLSGGEQQRVAVARALAQQPQVLLLDEATASLDIRHTLGLLQMVREQVRAGAFSVVAVLHDINLAARFCDELLFLSGGEHRAQGPTAKVLQPAILRQVYGVDSEITDNAFTGALQASLNLPPETSDLEP